MDYINIYSYKKVKTDKVYDIVKIVDVAEATINEDIAKIESGIYKEKEIKSILNHFEEDDFYFLESPVKILGLTLDLDKASSEEIITVLKNNFLDRYYIVNKVEDNIFLQDCFDKKIIESFSISASPSISLELNGLFDQMKSGMPAIIDASLKAKLLNQTDSLIQQDENIYKSVFDYDINNIYKELKEIVIGQDDILKSIISNIAKNISLSYSKLSSDKVRNLKSRILLVGSTGTGKTFIIENLASKFNVPYVIEDATRYTKNGFRGEDVENILLNLYYASEEDMNKFEHGIIFIDEIDKICKNNANDSDHIATTDVQEALLKIIDGTSIHKSIQRGISEIPLTFDTSKLTIVLSGAFQEITSNKVVTKDELRNFGMINELVGRINIIKQTNSPTKEDLYNALVDSKYGYINLFREYLSLYNIDLEIDDEFINYIIDKAYESNTGYRALNECLTESIDEYLFEVLSGNKKLMKLTNNQKNILNN